MSPLVMMALPEPVQLRPGVLAQANVGAWEAPPSPAWWIAVGRLTRHALAERVWLQTNAHALRLLELVMQYTASAVLA